MIVNRSRPACLRTGVSLPLTVLALCLCTNVAAAATEIPEEDETFAFFGWAIATDGDLLAIGAPGDNEAGLNAGAVYLYEQRSASWKLHTKILGDRSFAFFGASVALADDLLVVGAPYDGLRSTAQQEPGEVHVYRHRGRRSPKELAILRADPPTVHDTFGWEVATDGTQVLVGASRLVYDDHNDSGAFFYAEESGTWALTQTIHTSLDPVCIYNNNEADPCSGHLFRFGSSVALDDGRALIGDYLHDTTIVFAYDDDWTEISRIEGGDVIGLAGNFASVNGTLLKAIDGGTNWALVEPFTESAEDDPKLRVEALGDGFLVATSAEDRTDRESMVDYQIYRSQGDSWALEAALMSEPGGYRSFHNRRPVAIGSQLGGVGRTYTNEDTENEQPSDYAGEVFLFELSGEPLALLTAEERSFGCDCRASVPASPKTLHFLGILGLLGLLRRRRHHRPQCKRAPRAHSLATKAAAGAATGALALAVITAPRPADACSYSSPPYFRISERSPELVDVPIDGAFSFFIQGSGSTYEEYRERVAIEVSLSDAPVAGSLTFRPVTERPLYGPGSVHFTEFIATWRPESQLLVADASYDIRVDFAMANGMDYSSMTTAIVGSEPMGPLTPPEATTAALTRVEVGTGQEVCCESSGPDSCGGYYSCIFLQRDYQPGFRVEAVSSMSSSDALVTRSFIARDIDGEWVEVGTDLDRRYVYEYIENSYSDTAGTITFEAADSYCIILGAENLVTGEIVYGEPICLEHGDLEAPVTIESDPYEFQSSFTCEGGALYDIDGNTLFGAQEGGCRIDTDAPFGKAILLLILGPWIRRRSPR